MARYHDDPIEEVEQAAPRNKFFLVALAIFAISFGSTYAANISINTDRSSEFGQGIQVTSGCDTNIYVDATARFTNSSNAGNSAFGVETITISDIAASCIGKSFKLNLFDSVTSASLNSSPITISYAASPTNGQTFNGSTWSSGAADIKVLGANLVRATIDTTGTGLDSRAGKTSLSLTGAVTRANAKVQSVNVGRVSLESTKFIEIYSLGDTGPGGGTIFMTPGTLGNATGKYFEFAAADVASNVYWATGYSGVAGLNNEAGFAIGAGATNTAYILARSTGGGAHLAAAYSNNGYTDWFLGSLYEMQGMCMYAKGLRNLNPTVDNCTGGTLVGTWANEYITSSTRGYDNYTWRMYMTSIGKGFDHPAGAIRPLRMFDPAS